MTEPRAERTRRELRLAERFGARALLLAFAVVLVGVPFALLLTQVVGNGPLVEVDLDVAQSMHDAVRDRPVLVDLMQAVSWIGTGPWLWVVVLAGVVYWLRRTPRLAAFLAVTTSLGALINSVVKELVGRARPSFDEPLATALGKSFPSGHAMASTICYGALLLAFLPLVAVHLRKLVIAATVVLVLAIGFTRLALGVHYVTDVVGGFVLGAAWLCAATAAFQVWRRDEPPAPIGPVEESQDATLSPLGAAAAVEPHDQPAVPRGER
jgi:undecaprenyl-diphosphatase